MTKAHSELTHQLRHARRIWRIVWRVSILNLRARLQYRGDFVLQIFFGVMWQSSTLVFAGLLLTRFKGGLGTFPSQGVVLIIGIRLIAHGFYVLLFDNLYELPTLVDEGRMDGFFVRPLPVLTQLLLSQFRINSFGDLAVGITTFGYALTIVPVNWTAAKVAFLVMTVTSAIFVEAALQLVVACLLLHSPGAKILGVWIDELLGTFGNYPLSIMPRVIADLFTFALPLAFIAYFPAEILLDTAPRHGSISIVVRWSPAAGFVLFWLARRCWMSSLRRYQTAGG